MRLEVPVALKEMIAQPGLDSQKLSQLRLQFQQEAQILARLQIGSLKCYMFEPLRICKHDEYRLYEIADK